MTFGVIRIVVGDKILYKFGLGQYFIELTVLEIEWEALSRKYDNVRWTVEYNIYTTVYQDNYLLKML